MFQLRMVDLASVLIVLDRSLAMTLLGTPTAVETMVEKCRCPKKTGTEVNPKVDLNGHRKIFLSILPVVPHKAVAEVSE